MVSRNPNHENSSYNAPVSGAPVARDLLGGKPNRANLEPLRERNSPQCWCPR